MYDRDAAGDEDRPLLARAIRPSIPLVFTMMVVCWGMMALSEQVMWLHYMDAFAGTFLAEASGICGICLILAASLPVGLCILSRASGLARAVSVLISCALLSSGVGVVYWDQWEALVERMDAIPAGRKSVEVVSDATESLHGWSSDGRVLLDDGMGISVRLYWGDETDIVSAGYRFEAYGNITHTRATQKGRTAHQKGVCGSMSVHSPRDVQPVPGLVGLIAPLRLKIGDVLERIGGDGAALIEGVLLGDRSSVAGSTVEGDFRTCGLSHMLAVSGSHLVIVGALVTWLLSRLRLKRGVRACALLVFLALYVVLSGLQVSAIRAFWMTATGMTSQVFSRRRHSLSACSICVMVMLFQSPEAAFSFSLLLSAAAVYGIIVFVPLFGEWISVLLRGHARGLVEPVALTLAAQMSTLPITGPVFSLVSLVSPVANVIVAPLLTLLLGASLVSSLLLALPFVPAAVPVFLLSLASSFSNLVCQIVGLLASLPGAAAAASWPDALAVVCGVVACVALWAVWPHPSRRRIGVAAVSCVAVAVSLCAVASLRPAGQFVMLDVGQGDALLLRTADRCVLVDTGQYDAVLLAALARNGVDHLDAVFITHLDSDHCGALPALRNAVAVDRVYFTEGDLGEGFSDSDTVVAARDIVGDDDVCGLEAGDTVAFGAWELDVLSPGAFTDDGGNQDSLVLLATYDDDGDGIGDESLLLCGDAEHETLARLDSEGSLPDVDVLKVGHHGSSTTCTDEDLAVLTPVIALISVGVGNDYGHPSEEALMTLAAAGATVFRTDRDGDVSLELDDDAIVVTCGT